MFQILKDEPLISAFVFVFMGISILVQILLAILYQNMIRETDNMATTNNRLLKQCKLKFENCYQLNNGVANIPVFVEKFLNRLAWGSVSFDTLYHLSGQSILLSVICSGIGVCRAILKGRTLIAVFPYYIVSFLGLYLYFSISSAVDIKNKRQMLKVNLVDYLENHLSARIGVTEGDMEMLYGLKRGKRQRTVELMPINGRQKIISPAPSATIADMSAQASKVESVRISDEELADLIREFC